MTGAPRGAPSRQVVTLSLLVVLALRLLHMRFAIQGPLTWQLGADENYYLQFGRDVAFGAGGLTDLFAFMDPLYGYLLGAILRLGAGLFPLYLLQIGVDCASAYGLYRIGCALGRPRAGLIALLAYGVTGTAIAYTMAVLKETAVVAFVVGWTLLALRAVQAPATRRWLVLGLVTGLGVAIRANFLLLVPLAVPLLLALSPGGVAALRDRRIPLAAMALGLAVPLALLTARNLAISGKPSPMPNNGGIVLHQLYNPDNPLSRSGVPRFVGRYSAPQGIWQAYRDEAERRAGHALRPQQVSDYWGREARRYLLAHPGQTVANSVRKLREASAYPEVPNNRNYGDERRVSPLLAALPLPFGWWFALGLPGLLLLAWQDRRGLLVLAPALTSLLTLAVFFAEDRFRFHLVPSLVLGVGIWLDALIDAAKARRVGLVAAALTISVALGAWSMLQARLLIPEFPTDWPRLTWGYIKSGQRARAEQLIAAAVARNPDDPAAHELAGYLATRDERWTDAANHLGHIAARVDREEVWHNYSIALEHLGRVDDALAAEREAARLAPRDPTFALRLGNLADAAGRHDEAVDAWTRAAAGPDAQAAAEARAKLKHGETDNLGHNARAN